MKKFLSLIITLLFVTVSCGTPQNTIKTLKMSMKFVDDEQTAKTLKLVTEKINQRLEGSLQIQVFTGGQLPIGKDSLEQVISGGDWIFVDSHNFLGDYVPDYNAVTGPLLYNDFDEYFAMMRSDLVKGLDTEAEKQGMKILSHDYVFGFRSLLTGKAIYTPEDLKGIKVRVPNSQLYTYTLQAMGATTSPLPFTELYAALAQGVVDGLEGSILSIEGTKIYEYRKNYSLTKHLLGASAIVISPKVWESLTEEQRTVIQEEINNGAIYNTEETIQQEQEYTKLLQDQGVVFNEVNMESFQKVIANVYTQFPRWTPGIYQAIQEELKKIRQ
ncbi:MAG: C4-dicarboxylate TRAP transporter substrate-binding protein [Brevinema sp.]